jgi:mannose-6-phosphate isomerase
MMDTYAPLFFEPVYKDYVWGGDRIPRIFDRALPPGRYAESWEVSARPEGMSVVSEGPHAGRALADLIAAHGVDLLGARVGADRFPLLIKLIDARETLSVQVHPNSETAQRTGGEPKTEMWYVLDAAPEACVYVGFRPGVTPDLLRKALRDNAVEDLLVRMPVRPHDAIFVPGGRVHAIGAGCLLLECQQNSNTTYRLYDWGRVGADGKPRELHIEPALQAIDWDEPPSARATPRALPAAPPNSCAEIVRCPFFRMRRIELRAPETWPADRGSFRVLFAAEGDVMLDAGAHATRLPRGRSALMPADCPDTVVRPGPRGATILVMDIPPA